jgi:hypothetical protein
MSARFAPLAAAFVALLVVACATPPPVDPTPVPPAASSPSPVAVAAPTPTPVPLGGERTPPATGPTPTPTANAGDVDGWGNGPALTVEFPGDRLLDVTLEDASAKAWRVVVAGTGDLAKDRFEVVVEAGDVGPVINATEIQGGEVVDVIDLSFFDDETAAAGGCHRTLGVCVDSTSFTFADDGTGRLRVRLNTPKPSDASFVITGGTAGWPGEPFVLGPWSDTEAFPWGEG